MLVVLVPGLLVLLLPAVRIPRTTLAPAALPRRATMSVTDTNTAVAPNVTEAAAALKGQLHAQAAPEVQVRGLDERIFVLNRLLIGTVKGSIDAVYSYQDGGTLLQDVRRFYVLETVARVPYFAYLSVLHLRETLGERDLREVMRLHYAEADNELHHLLVMESLGGNSTAFDRTLAKTMAFFYYWYVVGVYAISPEAAYHLSELIEDHAFQTYDAFLGRRGAELQGLPVPPVAREYYEADEKFLFDLVTQSCRTDRIDIADDCPRRPNLQTLYDVFVCIRNDEKEVRRVCPSSKPTIHPARPRPRCLIARLFPVRLHSTGSLCARWCSEAVSMTRATHPSRAQNQSKSRAPVQSSPLLHSPAALRLLGWRWPCPSSPSRPHAFRDGSDSAVGFRRSRWRCKGARRGPRPRRGGVTSHYNPIVKLDICVVVRYFLYIYSQGLRPASTHTRLFSFFPRMTAARGVSRDSRLRH
jgi:ubiquinol oxidase